MQALAPIPEETRVPVSAKERKEELWAAFLSALSMGGGGGCILKGWGAAQQPFFSAALRFGELEGGSDSPREGTCAPRTPHLDRHECQCSQRGCVLPQASPQPRPDLMWQDAVCPFCSLFSCLLCGERSRACSIVRPHGTTISPLRGTAMYRMKSPPPTLEVGPPYLGGGGG